MVEQLANWLSTFADALPVIGVTALGIILFMASLRLALYLREVVRLKNRKLITLELTPPANQDSLDTQQLFSVLHGLKNGRTFLERALSKKTVFSLEIVATKRLGIRYLIGTDEQTATGIEKNIAAYLPEVRFKRLETEITQPDSVVTFKQEGHFAYPLKAQDGADPLAYITGAMTKLNDNEAITMQLVAAPVDVLEAKRLSRHLVHNEELLLQLGKQGSRGVGLVASGVGAIFFSILDAVGEMVTPTKQRQTSSNSHHKHQVATKTLPARTLSFLEQQLANAVHGKLSQPLFAVDIRFGISITDSNERKNREKAIKSAVNAYTNPGYQSLRIKRSWIIKPRQLFTRRLPSLFTNGHALLSASELASLYHFPDQTGLKTENLITSLSKTLPAPVSLKSGQKFDVILGRNQHHGTSTDIGLTEKERERHVYIIGGTGNGKTTMLEYAMIQDIKNGKGLAFVDPHGDAAEFLLHHIPEERINDVVYFNPDDLAHPIGLNLLELTPGLEGDELLREKDMVTEAAISVFRKIFSDEDNGGHRIEYVLRNSIQTALTIEGATIFTIFKLLNDPKFRKNAVAKLEDEDLKNFWKNELGKAGEFQRVKMSAGITAKIGRFLFSASAKRILEQPTSTINFDDVLDGKILICNFSKGLIGEDTSELFGITVLAKLQLAALRRARVPQAKRRPFYLYVDEFQNFATTSFVQLLSEARKYKLFLTMAEQSTSQQEEQQMVNVILANVGTVICFRSGNPADERMTLPLFKPYIEEGEIANLPSFNFYIRISAVHSQEPFSGETIVPEEVNKSLVQQVVVASRKNYASPKTRKHPEEATKTSTKKQTAKNVRKAKMKPLSENKTVPTVRPPGF